MDYEKMSNQALYRLLLEKYPGAGVVEVADYNRQTVIAFLTFDKGEARRFKDV